MKKLTNLLLVFMASLCSLNVWADREAPTMPEPQILENGHSYAFLYEKANQALNCSNNRAILSWSSTPLHLNEVDGQGWTIQYVSNNWYLFSSGTSAYTTSYVNSNCYWEFIKQGDGYAIQRAPANPDYVENQYLALASNGNLQPNQTTPEAWILLDIDACSRYLAEKQLYDALVLSDSYEYDVEKYEVIYANDFSTNEELVSAANALNSALSNSNKINQQEWSDYPILFEGNWTFGTSGISSPEVNVGETNLTATIVVSQNSTLVFDYKRPSSGLLNVYVDEELYQTIIPATFEEESRYRCESRYFIDVTPGKHEIRWSFSNNNPNGRYNAYLSNLGILNSRTISVSLLEPGSLGTEVLKQVDNIKNVRKLVISGEMNDDDWARINMMTYLVSLDLSGTNITSIANNQFKRGNFDYLHSVNLPETVTEIGSGAFDGSYIEDFIIPSSVKTIGESAFMNTRITEAMLPDDMISVGSSVFQYCYFLTKANFPASIEIMPSRFFQYCERLTDLTLHEGLKVLDLWAMRFVPYKNQLPSSITHINEAATADNPALTEIIVPENCTYMGLAAFQGCYNVKYVELPVGYYDCSGGRDLFNFWTLETLVIRSPTMLSGSMVSSIVPSGRRSAITLRVPDYLVNSYKQDSYWYEFGKIEGFSTSDVDFWAINKNLTMRSGERFEGVPHVSVYNGAWELYGDDAMTIASFYNRTNITGQKGMIISHTDNIQIMGTYEYGYYTQANKWYYLCLPFDAKVGDITNNANASYAIRYYDGANRAANGTGGNWKNYSKGDIIPAGTGFIFQTSKDCRSYFYAQDNASKQNVFSNREFVKALAANESETTSNKGWNLVGNPWQCYYNIHKVNFTAPITCWNVDKRNYTAYSIIDDDYAIMPGEAFFVQCPDEVNNITFPVDGRQTTNVIESQNGVKARDPQARMRWLVDVEISDREMSDKTRFVLNAQASMAYETTCDASKFFSSDIVVPQIYTIENDEPLAINERPYGEGSVKLGFKIAIDGRFTISAPRNQFDHIWLVDNETGTETDLATNDYIFFANAGINEGRFELHFNNGSSSGVDTMSRTEQSEGAVYNLAGQCVATPQKGIYIENRKKVVVK